MQNLPAAVDFGSLLGGFKKCGQEQFFIMVVLRLGLCLRSAKKRVCIIQP